MTEAPCESDFPPRDGPALRRRWHGGDAERFERSVRPHLGRGLRAAVRLLRSEDLAWDATQEALLALWNETEGPANVSGWLARAVRHRGLHLLRTRARRHKHECRAAAHRQERSERDDPGLVCQECEALRLFEEALARLPEEQRLVFTLCELEEKDYREAADVLGVPLGTVRSRLHRARQALRQALATGEGAQELARFFQPDGTKQRVAAL